MLHSLRVEIPTTDCKNNNDFEFVAAEKAPYRFDTVSEEAINHLKHNGFVVIKNILNAEEIIAAKQLLWNFLSAYPTQWDRNDASTWNCFPGDPLTGIISANGAGQCDFQWYIRSRMKVIKAFADVWSEQKSYKDNKQKLKVNDMLTSFDGFNVFRPYYINNGYNDWQTINKSWFHIDQNVVRNDSVETIQGIVTLYDVNQTTGSTVFIPSSNLWIADKVKCYKSEVDEHQHDFIRFDDSTCILSLKECQRKLIVCGKAGDLILWDSRCIHCNKSSLISSTHKMRKIHMKEKSKKNKNNNFQEKNKTLQLIDDLTHHFEGKLNMSNDETQIEFLRAISYVCMVPKEQLTNNNKNYEKIIKERIDAFEYKCTTTHWPTKCILSNIPNGLKKQSINDIHDKDIKKSLIGVDLLDKT